MVRVLYRILSLLALIGGWVPAAQAELRLDDWTRYGTLAEQGGICAGFARIMEMQSLIDGEAGRLWLERRRYAGAIVREATLMEGLPAATDSEINTLVENYAMWLVTSLVTDGGDTGLDGTAHERTGKMVADLCGTLFTQADMAISQKLPELLACQQTVTKSTPQTACTAETEAAAILQERVTALDRENTRLQAQMSRLQTDLAARKQLSDDSATPPSPTADGVSLPLPKPMVIAQLGSYQRYEQAVSGVAILRTELTEAMEDIRIDITEARLVNDTPVFRLLTQPLTKARSSRIRAAMWQAGFNCMLRGRR